MVGGDADIISHNAIRATLTGVGLYTLGETSTELGARNDNAGCPENADAFLSLFSIRVNSSISELHVLIKICSISNCDENLHN